MSGQARSAAQDQRLPWPTVRCFDCGSLYEIAIAPSSSEFVRPGSILATPQCPKCKSTAYSNLAKDQTAAQGQDDTLGVVWDKPDGRGGWISEASCWVEGCHVRVEGYDREEVERLLGEHHETFHGGTDGGEQPAATTVRCPECGREIGTWTREGELLIMGHRPTADHTPDTPWCKGGGRRV